MVEKGKVGYFGFSVGSEGQAPSKCLPEVQAQSRFAVCKKGLWLPYYGYDLTNYWDSRHD